MAITFFKGLKNKPTKKHSATETMDLSGCPMEELLASAVGGSGLTLGQGTKISQPMQHSQKNTTTRNHIWFIKPTIVYYMETPTVSQPLQETLNTMKAGSKCISPPSLQNSAHSLPCVLRTHLWKNEVGMSSKDVKVETNLNVKKRKRSMADSC